MTNVDYAGNARGACLTTNCLCPEFAWLGDQRDLLCSECRCRAFFHVLISSPSTGDGEGMKAQTSQMFLSNTDAISPSTTNEFEHYAPVDTIGSSKESESSRTDRHVQNSKFREKACKEENESSPPGQYKFDYSAKALEFMNGEDRASSKYHFLIVRRETVAMLGKYIPRKVADSQNRNACFYFFFEALMNSFPQSHAWRLGKRGQSLPADEPPSCLFFKTTCTQAYLRLHSVREQQAPPSKSAGRKRNGPTRNKKQPTEKAAPRKRRPAIVPLPRNKPDDVASTPSPRNSTVEGDVNGRQPLKVEHDISPAGTDLPSDCQSTSNRAHTYDLPNGSNLHAQLPLFSFDNREQH